MEMRIICFVIPRPVFAEGKLLSEWSTTVAPCGFLALLYRARTVVFKFICLCYAVYMHCQIHYVPPVSLQLFHRDTEPIRQTARNFGLVG